MSSASAPGRNWYWCRLAARALLVIAYMMYAAAKFTGAQFVIPGYLLDTPVADLGGMDLTWAFFAHSPMYAGFVAVGQLVAAVLLTFDRSARLGAVISLPISANIALVNIGYDIGTDTLILSLVLFALNVFLVAGEFAALKACFWDETASANAEQYSRRRGLAVAAIFVAGVVGMFGIFTAIMSGSAGGQKAIAGDWLVETATINGKPVTDRELGADWLWVSFDPHGRFSARTKRWTIHGKHTVNPATEECSVRYDPEPLPPIYPGQSFDEHHLSPEEIKRVLDQTQENKWPIDLAGGYQKEGHKLILKMRRGEDRIEWRLAPYKRPKF